MSIFFYFILPKHTSMKFIIAITFCLVQQITYSQSNYIFSISKEYDLHIELGSFSYKKPETWQLRFENIVAGTYRMNITVSKPGTNYRSTRAFDIKIFDGYEVIYYVTPYSSGIEYDLAAYYDLKKLQGSSSSTDAVGSDGRYITYQGKPVFSKADIDDLKNRAKAKKFDDDISGFLKQTMSKGMFYTEDVISVLSILKFDDTRVSLAKYLYDNTIDKHKYYQLSVSFKFSSSFEEVMTYISKR